MQIVKNLLHVFRKWINESDTSAQNNSNQNQFKAEISVPDDLSKYENRRLEIVDSTEPIEGIFYIYNNMLIPDYYSERLWSEKKTVFDNKEMYHDIFFEKYMIKKFPAELSRQDYKDIPRGRIIINAVMLDKCYYQDQDIQKKIIELYHLPVHMIFRSGEETGTPYTCIVCRDEGKQL